MMYPSVWSIMAPHDDLPTALSYLHQRGWQWFELSDEHLKWIHANDDGVDATLAALEELHVTMPQAHSLISADVLGQPNDVERLMADLDVCAKIGVTDVVIHPGTGQGYANLDERAQQIQLNAQAFGRLGQRAGELGLRIGIENLSDMFAVPGRQLIGSMPQDLLELIDAIGLPNVGVTFDTSHANIQGLDIPQAVRALGDRLFCTHISDNDGTSDQHQIPGNSRGRAISWHGVMQAFADIGYEGIFNLEIPGARSSDPQLLHLNTCHALHVTQCLIAMVDKTQA